MPQLLIEILNADEEMIMLQIGGNNGYFAGTTITYINAGANELVEIVDHLSGFPKDYTQEELFHFGFDDAEIEAHRLAKIRVSLDQVKLRFHCINRAGHTALDLKFKGNFHLPDPGESSFTFEFEPYELDEFLSRLKKVIKKRLGRAVLAGKPYHPNESPLWDDTALDG